jgi:hypothetical protein
LRRGGVIVVWQNNPQLIHIESNLQPVSAVYNNSHRKNLCNHLWIELVPNGDDIGYLGYEVVGIIKKLQSQSHQ